MLRKSIRQSATVFRTKKALNELRNFAREAMEHAPLDDYERGLVLLCIDEVLTAVVENAEHFGNPESELRLVIDINDVRIRIMIEDSETHFNSRVDEEIFRNIREDEARREIDVFFLSSVMDEITYNYQKGLQNVLVMTKFLPGAD